MSQESPASPRRSSLPARVAWSLAVVAQAFAITALAAPKPTTGAARKPAVQRVAWGRLVLDNGKTVHLLDKPSVVVGNVAGAGADIVIAHPTVSPRHCRIRYADGRVTIEDLGSRHGTLLAGMALVKGKPVPILQKTTLTLAAVPMDFEFGERPAFIRPSGDPPPSGTRATPKAPAPAKPAPAPAVAPKAAP